MVVEDWHRMDVLMSQVGNQSICHYYRIHVLLGLYLNNRHRLLDWLLDRSRLYLDYWLDHLRLLDFNKNSSLAFCPVGKVKVVDVEYVFKDTSPNMIS